MRFRLVVLAFSFVFSACGGDSNGVSSDSLETQESIMDGAGTEGLNNSSDDDSAPFPANTSDQDQFLLDNAARSAVTVTESGLHYEELIASMGAKPTAQSTVTLHYTGTKTDGTEFDSSFSRGEPATFVVSGTIQGFSEGVQLMSVGSTSRIVVPSELAYGDAGAAPGIGPDEVLIFVIELLEINAN